MKIAILSIAKPETGTGNGTTEYAFQLSQRLKAMKGNRVENVYAIDESKRRDTFGLVKMHLAFPRVVRELAKKDYDIIHITIQEIGFAARILKENGSTAKVITTIHDLTRLTPGMHRGVRQTVYNELVKSSIGDAVRYSDFISFNSSQTKEEVGRKFGKSKRSRVIWHGTRKSFLDTPIKKKKLHSRFRVGYIGSLGSHKNVIALARVATYMRRFHNISFLVYGTGADMRRITFYTADNNLHNLHMMGFVKEKDLIKTLDGLDVFVMPSLYEGLSHQILEAGARGIPMVVFKDARIPKEVTKMCYKARNEAQMAEAIRHIYENGFSASMRAREIKYYKSFTWDRTALESYRLYKELLGVKG